MSTHSLVRSLLVVVMSAYFVLSSVNVAGADSSRRDPGHNSGNAVGLEDTGVSFREPQLLPLTAEQQAQVAAKDRDAADIAARIGAWDRNFQLGLVSPQALPPGDAGLRYTIPEGETWVLRQVRSYWCGPATIKNMTRIMHKIRYGEYWAPTEATFAGWLGTTTSGTSVGAFPNVLNSHYSSYGGWTLRNPSTANSYLGYIASDTHRYHQPVIQGVWTRYLTYYHGWSLNHFNFAIGFDDRVGYSKKVRMGDPFDPQYLGYSSYPVNPHGRWWEPLGSAFKANDLSGPAHSSAYKRLVV